MGYSVGGFCSPLQAQLPPRGQPHRLRMQLVHAFVGWLCPPACPPQLRGRDLAGNKLRSALPGGWGAAPGLRQLRLLDLAYNSIEGPLPPAWSSLASLQQL